MDTLTDEAIDKVRLYANMLRNISGAKKSFDNETAEMLEHYAQLIAEQPKAEPQGTVDDITFRVNLTCCGRDEGYADFPTWEQADAFRDSYTSGHGVEENGYSASGWMKGHMRSGVISKRSAMHERLQKINDTYAIKAAPSPDEGNLP